MAGVIAPVRLKISEQESPGRQPGLSDFSAAIKTGLVHNVR
jgi:hypothetical protein